MSLTQSSKESIEEWLLDAQAFGEWRTPREGKTVYVGETIRERDGETCVLFSR